MRVLPKDSHTLQHKPGIADLLRVAPRAMAAPGSVSNSTQSHMPRRQQAARHRLIRKKAQTHVRKHLIKVRNLLTFAQKLFWCYVGLTSTKTRRHVNGSLPWESVHRRCAIVSDLY
jgi:hypothetical protein